MAYEDEYYPEMFSNLDPYGNQMYNNDYTFNPQMNYTNLDDAYSQYQNLSGQNYSPSTYNPITGEYGADLNYTPITYNPITGQPEQGQGNGLDFSSSGFNYNPDGSINYQPQSNSLTSGLGNLFSGMNNPFSNLGNTAGSLLNAGAGAGATIQGTKAMDDAYTRALAAQQNQMNYQQGLQQIPLNYQSSAYQGMANAAGQAPPTLRQAELPGLRTSAGLMQGTNLQGEANLRGNAGMSELSYDPATILANSPDLQNANTKALETIRAQAAAGLGGSPYGSGNMYSAEAENLRAGNMNYLGQVYGQSLSTNQNNNAIRQNELQNYNNAQQMALQNRNAAEQGNFTNYNAAAQQGYLNANNANQQMYQNANQQGLDAYNAAKGNQQMQFNNYSTLANYGNDAAKQLGAAGQNYADNAGSLYQLQGANQANYYKNLYGQGASGGNALLGNALLGNTTKFS